jgi:hypothetical protein
MGVPIDLAKMIAEARDVTPTAGQWFAETAPPANDPFVAKKQGVALPVPAAIKPSSWMSQLYTDLQGRLAKGYDMLDQAGLSDDDRAKFTRRLTQLAWQVELIRLTVREYAPCPPGLCPNRVGGMPGWIDPDHRDQYVREMREVHGAGLMAVKVQTPGGRTYTLVPWRSDPPVPGELEPLDMAALARVAALAGTDELTLLDRIQTEVTGS